MTLVLMRRESESENCVQGLVIAPVRLMAVSHAHYERNPDRRAGPPAHGSRGWPFTDDMS